MGKVNEEILTTALEGGIGYWACLDNTRPEWIQARQELKEKNGGYPYSGEIADKILDEGHSIFFEDAEDEDSGDIYELTLQGFYKGWDIWERETGRKVSDEICDGNFDADDADCLIQYAIFGEIVFS